MARGERRTPTPLRNSLTRKEKRVSVPRLPRVRAEMTTFLLSDAAKKIRAGA
jgi:hypothetical protein